MKSLYYALLVWLSSFLLLCKTAAADALIVSDALLLEKARQQLESLEEQHKLLEKHKAIALSQLGVLKELKNFNSGHFQFGAQNNGLKDLAERQWSADNWEEALQNVAGHNPERYQDLVRAYAKKYPLLDGDSYKAGSNEKQWQLYQQNRAVNQAVSVETTYAYNDINKHIQSVYDLSTQIEKADNTKAILDLNTRLLAELAYIQTQNLKVQTLISHQLAQNTANDLAEDSQSVLFNRLPKPSKENP